MECNVCGRHRENEDANFCENCGNSFRENYQDYNNQNNTNQYTSQSNTSAYRQRSYYGDESQTNYKREEPVSFKNWLFTLALPILLLFIPIPFVGPLAYIVILFIWAFGNNTNPNKKNWARANLIVTAIVLVLSIIFVALIFSFMMDGTIPIEGFEGFENFGGMNGFY